MEGGKPLAAWTNPASILQIHSIPTTFLLSRSAEIKSGIGIDKHLGKFTEFKEKIYPLRALIELHVNTLNIILCSFYENRSVAEIMAIGHMKIRTYGFDMNYVVAGTNCF